MVQFFVTLCADVVLRPRIYDVLFCVASLIPSVNVEVGLKSRGNLKSDLFWLALSHFAYDANIYT